MISKHTPTLRQRVLQSGSWALAGYGVTQALRFGGNLILTRLLFPEAFGLMAIINAVLFGVHMLTDVGIGASIVQKKQGNDPVFLNTAWTVQIVRGFLAWGVLCALALPMAAFFNETMLATMIPVVGLSAIISGFNSTKLFTADRNLAAVRVIQIDIVTSALGLLCMVYLAWLMQSVWVLAWGSLITVTLKMLASHLLLDGIKNQFAWNRDALDHLSGFGRWILLSSGLTFLSVEGARLVIGAMLDMRQLALFTLASTMSLVLWQATLQLIWKIFFPAYSETVRSNPENLNNVLLKSRLVLILLNWGLAVLFVFFGSQLMEVLYDERYHGSGIMLEQLAAGLLVACIWGTYFGVLIAMGKVVASTALTAIHIICQFSMMLVGMHYWGAAGLVIGMAAANWLVYPANAFVMYKNSVWQPKLDLVFFLASVLIVVLAWPDLTKTQT